MSAIDQDTINKVKQWVSLDNKIELKKIRLKDYADEKKALEEDIISYIEQNNKVNLQINTSDGYIDFSEQKSNQVMSLKYIKDTLDNFFANNTDKTPTAAAVFDHLLSNREQKTKVVMKRHITS